MELFQRKFADARNFFDEDRVEAGLPNFGGNHRNIQHSINK
jgi:hypothetical protein